MTVTIEGLDTVLNNLNAEVKAMDGRTMAGLLAAGLIVEGSSKRKVPVEYGNLRGSGYSRKAMDGSLAVEVGFTAAYSLFVHENMEQRLAGQPRPSGLGVYWGGQPDSGPKFLTRALTETSELVLRAVAGYAKP